MARKYRVVVFEVGIELLGVAADPKAPQAPAPPHRILYEKTVSLKLSRSEVYYTA